MDADLQTAPKDFNLLLPYREEYQLMTGIRANRKDTAFKRFQSRFANGFRNMMTHDGMQDTGCPLKIMQSDYAKRAPFFHWDASFPPCPYPSSGGESKAVACASLSSTAWGVEVSPLEPSVGTIYGLFRISLDEEALYQLQGFGGQFSVTCL